MYSTQYYDKINVSLKIIIILIWIGLRNRLHKISSVIGKPSKGVLKYGQIRISG